MTAFDLFLSYADTYSPAIQAVSTVVLVLTAALALIWNEKMASVMQKTYELSARPYAGIDRDFEIIAEQEHSGSDDTKWVELKYQIVNLGQVAVVFTVTTDRFRDENAAPAKKAEVVLYPKQSIYHFSHYDVPETKVADLRGEAELTIEYAALGVPQKKYFHRRVIEVKPFSNYTIIKDEAGEVPE